MKKTNFTTMMSLVVLALIHVAVSITDNKVIDSSGLAFISTLMRNDMFIIYSVSLLIFICSVSIGLYNLIKKLK